MNQIAPTSTSIISSSEDVVMKEEKSKEPFEKIIKYLSSHTVYEAIPENMKILVFNSELPINECITAMANEDIYCSFIWDSSSARYTGLMTIRDVLGLVKYINDKIRTHKGVINNINSFVKEIFCDNNNNDAMDIDDSYSGNNITIDYADLIKSLNNITISDYLQNVKTNNNIISISLDGSLYDCIKLIGKHKIHRLIIEDPKTKNFTGFITYETIFQFIMENYILERAELAMKLKDIYKSMISDRLVKFEKDELVYSIFEKALLTKISIMPIYDKQNLFGFLYLKDIVYFFTNYNMFSFNDTVEKFLTALYAGVDEERPLGLSRVCLIDIEKEDIDMKALMEMMAVSPERKIIVKKDTDISIITLSSIFKTIIDYK